MDHHDRELLGKQMSQLQFAPRRDGRLIFGLARVDAHLKIGTIGRRYLLCHQRSDPYQRPV